MQCDMCPGPAAYTRRYSGQSLCSECFSASIRQKAARTISRYGMIRRGDRVAVAVSGGKDSLSLLHVLSEMSGDRGFEMSAVTIDEGIPGYRDEALGIVERYCGKLGVPYTVTGYGDMYGMTLQEALDGRRTRVSSCSLCGVLRRRAIDRAAGDADVVATAHNMDDYLQTFMLNILSGDAAKIAWMNPGGGGTPRRVKPFCEIYESEIVFYAYTNGIPFQTEPCPHMNEGMRTAIREFLNGLEAEHSGVKNSMYRAVQKLVPAAENSKAKRACGVCGGVSTSGTCSVCRMLERHVEPLRDGPPRKMHI